MKKITLLLLILFSSISGYSQLALEGFENTTGPDAFPSTNWTLGTGDWAVFDNGVGSTQRWKINSAITTPASVYQGVNAAYVDRENINAGNTSEEFLATPAIPIPVNGVLHFYTRMNTSGDQGTIYQIRVASAIESQTDPFAYSLVQQWTEDQLIVPTSNFNTYTEKTVDLSAYANQFVYVSFVKIFTQSGPGTGGDTWFIDNVSIDAACLTPTVLTSGTITSNSATLNWTNPNGVVNGWEIEVIPATGTPTGVANYTTTTFPYVVTGLLPNTAYKFYVRARCTTGIASPWSVASANFTTLVAPPVCGGNYLDQGVNGNYPNGSTALNGGTTLICPTTPGDVVTVTFTSFNTEVNNDVLKIYNGNNTLTANLIGTYSGTTPPPVITSSATDGCLSFVFTSNNSITAEGWSSNITCGSPVACTKPIALTSSSVLSNSVSFGWTATGIASTWQVIALPCSSPAPTALTTGWVSAGTNPFTINGLNPATCYNLYVRSDCGSSGTSEWAGPISITTQAAPPVCGGNYLDSGGLASNYGNNITAATGTTTIFPVNGGDVVTVTFTSFNTEANNDELRVYNGTVVSAANLIGTFSGTTIPPSITSSAIDGSLTFVFTSNATVTSAGWVSNITCGPPPTCSQPLALTTSSLVANSVSLGWTNSGSSLAWQVLVLPCSSPEPTNSTTGWQTATTNPFLVNGLSATTCYKLYVRTDCAATSGGTSEWSLPVTITTPCSFYNVPFQEGFNTGSTSEQCWKVLNTNADTDQWDMNYAQNPFEGDQAASILTDFNNGANNDWLISPQIVLTANQRLKFHYRVQSAGEPNEFRVMLSTTGSNPADFTQTLVPIATYSNIAYVEKKVNISAYSGPVYIAWQVPPGTIDGWRIYIDNVIVEDLPVCPEPENVIADAVTSSSVNLAWTNGNTETAWEVIALPCGTAAPTATSTGVPAGTNPFTLTNLNPNTCYDIYVRALCSLTEKSIWTIATTINTLCTPFNVPFQEGFNSTSTTQRCWTVLNVNNDTDSWNMDYTPNPFEGDESATLTTDFNGGANNDWLISPQIVLNGNQRLRYRYRVESTGEPNEFRVMLSTTGTAPASFTTTLVPLATYSNTTYVERIVTLTGISGNANIGFHVPSGTIDGWRIYIDKVIVENIPTCLPSTTLTVADISSTSAVLGWTDTNTTPASQWEIIYVPQGSPDPLPTDTGVIVSTNPVLITGLTPGTPYTYYVRAVCSSTDKSEWSTGFNFTTLIINDNCDGAVFAPVNSSLQCQQVTPGTITGATASLTPPIAPCIGTADDDVWFQFIASNTYLSISLENVQGFTNLNFAVYSGECGTLTQRYCSAANSLNLVLNNLVLGQTYYIRVYSNANTPQISTFDLCLTTPSTCANSNTICNLLGENTPSTVGITSLGTIGCLFSSPNPTFYTLEVATTGPINLFMSQNALPNGQGVGRDIDYAAWGPFTSQTQACSVVGNQFPFAPPGIGVPVTLTTGCSFSGASTETLNIANAQAGQIYIILITNFSGQPGFINLEQTNFGQPGSGTVNCCPEAFFQYQPSSYCKTPGNPNPIAVISPGSLSGVFSSPYTPGLVFANTATGEIDLMASAPGNYVIVNTIPASGTCQSKERTYTINISEPTSATISYGSNSPMKFCKSITALQPVTQTGTTGGSYSAIPNVGLSINPTTGEINPSLSSPGIYNVVYGLPGSICTVGNPSAQVEILALPTIVQPAPVAACYNFTLPSIAVGNYFSQTGGIGPLDITQPITNSQAIYIYAVGTNGCINEKSFAVTINSVPTPTFTTTESACSPPNGTITVISPTSPINPLPTDLFISAVTDEPTGNLTYVELFNGTGAPINLSNYKLKFTYFGGLGSTNSTFPLTGTINNNTFKLVKISNDANATGVIPDLSCTTCSGVNTNDNISLQRTSGSNVDVWGTNNGTNFTPGPTPGTSTVGYTYQRKNNVTIPSTTWNPNDWTAIDVVSGTIVYTSVLNKFTLLPVSNYQFAVDGGPFQNPVSLPVTFTGLAAGNHTLVVKDVITGCLSDAVTVPINLLNPTPIVTGFSYPASVCQNGTNPLPGNFATGFTPGGTYSEDTNVSTGLVFVSTSSGEIDLINSTPGNHTIKYTVLANPLLCLEGGESSATIEIKPKITPIIGFSYPASICKNAQPALLTPSATGLSSFAIFSANPAGLIFTNTSTGIIDLANSTPGIYNIVVDVIADSNTCRISATTSPPVQLEIKPVITLETGFNYDTPFCASTGTELPNLNTGFATGGIFSSTNGLIIDPSTGAIDLTSTPGQYTITYNVIPNSTNCEVAPPGTTQIMIVPPVTIEINGGCQSINYILTATPVNGSFIPETASYSWQNAAGIEVGTTQSITVTEVDVYTVTITVDGCSTESLPFDVTSVSCVIQKGISVNNDDLNDTFDLSGFDVKNLTIFNRLGMKVYTRNDYVDEWGGKSDDGDELPDGTYYYVIQQRSGTVKTGWIYINRAQ